MIIIEDSHLLSKTQVRFPRSKKKRIRKKWAKQERNFSYRPSKEIYPMGDTILCHPIMAQKIRKLGAPLATK